MNHKYQLTKLAVKGGCAAKQGPKVLQEVLKKLPEMSHEHLLVGYQSSDDAAVYLLNEEQALIQTVDFFPPPVDDPYLFGQIAATNALSDVYAMGGTPVLALNLLAFPCSLEEECVKEILRGGYEKVAEAGAVVAGGHTIDDKEPKYGLSVSGLVDPKKIWRNDQAQEGDVLILTKPIGFGIYALASRGELLSDEEEDMLMGWMTTLNRKSRDVFSQFTVHACTDITGFGLLGHMYEMASGSEKSIELEISQIPFLPRVTQLAGMGIIPAGAYANRDYLMEKVQFEESVEECYRDCLFDPQTSGGLVAAIPEAEAEKCLKKMKEEGVFAAAIGKVTIRKKKAIEIND